jgi:hypothetical protein
MLNGRQLGATEAGRVTRRAPHERAGEWQRAPNDILSAHGPLATEGAAQRIRTQSVADALGPPTD